MSADKTREQVNQFARVLIAEWERVEGPVSASYVANFADMARALLSSGLIPEGATTVEWQMVSSPALRLDRRTPPLDDEQHARSMARCNRGSVVCRTRTSYPDRVTDWEPR
jgi:hypothetical protein